MRIKKSSEDYLEAIFVLKKTNTDVRSIDIVRYMGYSKPSISNAITVLQNAGLITWDDDKYIDFTSEGERLAEKIYAKHEFFKEYLISIGVDEITAEQDACRIEHDISDESFEKIKINLGGKVYEERD